MGDKLMKKNFQKLILAVFLLVPCFVLVGCGKSASNKISVNLVGGNENIYFQNVSSGQTSINFDNVSSKDNYEIAVVFNNGFDHTALSATLNGEYVSGSFVYSDGSVIGNSVDYSQSREWHYSFSGVKADQNLQIDVSKCQKASLQIGVVEDLSGVVRYGVRKDSVGTKYISNISNNMFKNNSTFDLPADGKIDITYGDTVYMFVKNTFFDGCEDYALKVGADEYVYSAKLNGEEVEVNGYKVFVIKNIDNNIEVSYSKKSKNNQYYDSAAEYPNVFSVEHIAWSSSIIDAPYTDSENYDSENTITVNGKVLKAITSYFGSGLYMYVGENQNPTDDPVIDSTNTWLSNKMYIVVSIAGGETIPEDAVLYFMDNDRGDNKTAIDSTKIIKIDDYKVCVILEKADVERYLKDVESNGQLCKTGHAYIGFDLPESRLQEKFGVKVRYNSRPENYKLSDSIVGFANSMPYVKYEQVNGEMSVISYWNMSQLAIEENKMYVMAGSTNNDVRVKHYTGAKIMVLDATGQMIGTQIDYNFTSTELQNNNAQIEIPSSILSQINGGDVVEICIELKEAISDQSNHTIDFSNIDLSGGKKILFSTDFNASMDKWIEVNEDNKALVDVKISAGSPLYYIVIDMSYSLNSIKLYYGDINNYVDVSTSSSCSDVEDQGIFVEIMSEMYSVKYLALNKTFMENECKLNASAD